MRISRKLLLGGLIAMSLAVCSVFAQAVPDTGIGLHAELLPEAPTNFIAVNTAPIAGDQVAYTFVATHNFSVVSLDTERQIDLAIESAYLATDLTLAFKEADLLARLTNEVGWYSF